MTFTTRMTRDRNTGEVIPVRSSIPIVKVTEDQLRKEIQMLKEALLDQEQIRSENKRLKVKIKEVELKNFKLGEKLRKTEILLKPPTKEMLLRVAPLLVEAESAEPKEYKKNKLGQWVEVPIKPKK